MLLPFSGICCFPKFEPVYGGWFSEWGTSLLLLMILYTLWNDLVKAYSFRLTFSEEQRQLTRQIAIQKTHYQDLSDRIEETVRIRHDFSPSYAAFKYIGRRGRI